MLYDFYMQYSLKFCVSKVFFFLKKSSTFIQQGCIELKINETYTLFQKNYF